MFKLFNEDLATLAKIKLILTNLNQYVDNLVLESLTKENPSVGIGITRRSQMLISMADEDYVNISLDMSQLNRGFLSLTYEVGTDPLKNEQIKWFIQSIEHLDFKGALKAMVDSDHPDFVDCVKYDEKQITLTLNDWGVAAYSFAPGKPAMENAPEYQSIYQRFLTWVMFRLFQNLNPMIENALIGFDDRINYKELMRFSTGSQELHRVWISNSSDGYRLHFDVRGERFVLPLDNDHRVRRQMINQLISTNNEGHFTTQFDITELLTEMRVMFNGVVSCAGYFTDNPTNQAVCTFHMDPSILPFMGNNELQFQVHRGHYMNAQPNGHMMGQHPQQPMPQFTNGPSRFF